MKPKQYTLVQHSGVTTEHAEFSRAVEPRAVVSKVQAEKITAAGGLLFDDYMDAENAAEAENYPPGVHGLVPQAWGTFLKDITIEGAPVYIPKKGPSPQAVRAAVDQLQQELTAAAPRIAAWLEQPLPGEPGYKES